MEQMSNLILIDKPQGFTSFDVVAKLRGILRQKKIGHTGTLDPMATGVLVCLVGKATKLAERMPSADKRYTATVRLGMTTDTQDSTGTVLTQCAADITREQLAHACKPFVGEISQLPPMYSAVSVGGRRLYDLAREGVEVERTPRRITVYSLDILDFDRDGQTAVLDVCCSKGSYIRTLAHDIGASLGVGGTLTALRRTEACGFSLDGCHTLAQLQQAKDEDRLSDYLLPPWTAFADCPRIQTGAWQRKMLANGVPLLLDKLGHPAAGCYTLWCGEEFLGIGEVAEQDDCIRMLYLDIAP